MVPIPDSEPSEILVDSPAGAGTVLTVLLPVTTDNH